MASLLESYHATIVLLPHKLKSAVITNFMLLKKVITVTSYFVIGSDTHR